MPKHTARRLLMYRYSGEKLEIFLEKVAHNQYHIPKKLIKLLEAELDDSLQEYADSHSIQKAKDHILLEPITDDNGELEHTIAMDESSNVKGSSYFFPDVKEGKFYDMKEALKKVMPKQYQQIKELHEILEVRNIIKYL